jgi:hypothetical protein
MKKKILLGFVALILVLIVGRIASLPTEKFKAGDTAPVLSLTNIHGNLVSVPNPQSWVHLQFRRFAGCPICNLHLQSFIQRYGEIKAAGIQEVVVFHSPNDSLLPYQGKFPFDVIGDPEKKLYAEYGVQSSIFAILDFRAWPSMVEGGMAKDKPSGSPEGGPLGLPADFLIGQDGKIMASHYGAYAYDQWSVDDLLKLASH